MHRSVQEQNERVDFAKGYREIKVGYSRDELFATDAEESRVARI